MAGANHFGKPQNFGYGSAFNIPQQRGDQTSGYHHASQTAQNFPLQSNRADENNGGTGGAGGHNVTPGS